MTVVGTDISSAQLEIASAKDHAANLCYRYKITINTCKKI